MPRKENRRVPVVLNPCSLLWCLLILVTLPATGWALPLEEDPEQSDYPPGLLATYRVGEAEIQRIDADIAFDWGAQIPDSRLPAGSFTVDWSGYFLMKAPGTYRFHAYVAGDIEVLLDDRPNAGTGEKLTDAELLGCPLRLVVGKRGVAEGVAESQERASGEEGRIPLGDDLVSGVREILDRIGSSG